MMTAAMPSTSTKKRTVAKGKEPDASAKPTLAEIGKAASHEAQRKALLAELKRQGWNLTRTAEVLGVSSTSNLIRSIRTLGLDEEYEAAKADGRITNYRRDE